MRRFYVSMMLLAVSLIATAQDKMTLDARMLVDRQQAAEQTARRGAAADETRVTLVVKVADEGARETYDAIRAAGGRIEGVLGRQAIVNMPIDGVKSLEALEGIERIDNTHSGKPLTDISVKETKVSEIINQPAGAVTSLTGKGVMVCIIDAGICFRHPAFTDANGQSRIKCVYMMDQKASQATAGHKQLTYTDANAGEVTAPGYYYDDASSIAALPDDDGFEDTHGTHTAGIAVGAKSDKGFTGMAPEADIMFIPIDAEFSPLTPETFARSMEKALMFAVNYAKQKNLNLIINMSLGSHNGPHNGTGTVPELLDEAAKTTIPVMAAGNEGSDRPHLHQTFTATDNTARALLPMTEKETILGSIFSGSTYVYGISRQPAVNGKTIKVKLGIYNGSKTYWEHTIDYKVGDPAVVWRACSDAQSSDAFTPYDATLEPFAEGYVSIAAGVVGGKLNIKAAISASSITNPDPFEYVYPFSIVVEGYDGLEMDIWGDTGFGDVEGYTKPDNEISGGDWTSAPSVISVGAYCTNTTERNLYMKDNNTSARYPLGDIADFSSYATFSNGVTTPTVCAPAVNIVSSVNPRTIDSEDKANQKTAMMWKDYPYNSSSGTSMACPHVAGIIALWMQVKPDLTTAQVKDVLQNACDNDEFTAQMPQRWGYGKINAKKGLEYLLSSTGIKEVESVNAEGQSAKIYDLQGRQVANPTRGLYIVNGRKVIVR